MYYYFFSYEAEKLERFTKSCRIKTKPGMFNAWNSMVDEYLNLKINRSCVIKKDGLVSNSR